MTDGHSKSICWMFSMCLKTFGDSDFTRNYIVGALGFKATGVARKDIPCTQAVARDGA